MKLWTNLKSLIASDLATKDYTVRLSQIARLWDAGLDLITGKGKGRPGQPYSQVDWVWICVNLILDTCKSIPMLISTDDDEVIESGPVADFLYSRTFANIFRDTLGFYTLCREAYWITTASDGIAPKTITVAGPNSVEPVVSRATGELVAYRVRLSAGKTVTLDPEDVFALRNFNPYDAFRGMGPQTAGQLAISTAYQASQFNEASLANGARIGLILKPLPGVKLDDEDVRKLKSQFKANHGGAANAGEAFIAHGIDDIKTFTQTMADLQMVDLSRYNANTVCALFGVPQEIVGLNSEAQYAHGPATQRFILYCIAPLLTVMADAIDDGIISKFRFKSHLNKTSPFAASRFASGNVPLKCRRAYRDKKLQSLRSGKKLFCWFDTDSHPAIQEMMRDLLTKLLPLVDKGVPLNQIIDANDLPYDTSKMPWGEHWWIPMGQVPAAWTLDAGPDALTGPVIPEGAVDEDNPGKSSSFDSCHTSDNYRDTEKDIRSRIWAKYAASFAPIETQYKSALRSYFRRQKSDILARLERIIAMKGSDIIKADDLIARIMFDISEENKKLIVLHKVFFGKASDLGIAQSLSEVTGAEGQPLADAVRRLRLSPTVRNAIAVSSHKITLVNKTTQNRIARQLVAGLEAGEGLPQLKRRIDQVIDTSSAATGRAGLIARTQTAGGVSAGRQAGLSDAGVELKGWLSAQDSAVRPTHKNADYKYADGIPINHPFDIGGVKLMYPGDPNSTDVGEIANCRCALVPVAAHGKTWTLTDYDQVKVLTYAEIEPLLNEVSHA